LALGALIACALLAIAECGARLVRPRAPTQTMFEQGAFEASRELGWRIRPGFRGDLFGGERSLDTAGFATVDAVGAADARQRVLFLGDSRTFGNGVATADSFVELLAARLPALHAIGLGIPGYTSFQGQAALRDYAPRLNPRVVVFAYGFNDRRYVVPPLEPDGAAYFERLAARASWARLGRSLALVELLGSLRRVPREEGAVPRAVDLGALAPRVSAGGLRQNLTDAARYCASHGIAFVLLLFDDNPADNAALDAADVDARAGRTAAAEQTLQAAVARRSHLSDVARLALAQLYAVTRREQEAAAVRISPETFVSLAGGRPLYTSREVRAIHAEVAAAERVPLIDAGAAIDQHPEWYFDVCHFTRDGHRAVADLLEPALAALSRGLPVGSP
jgi:lysophospholipase L1-like esterase